MVAQINRLITHVKKNFLKLLAGLFPAAVLMLAPQAYALETFITDEEAETLLHQIIRPVFKVADVTFDPRKIFIINDLSLNAFVTDGNYLFVHTGTLINADNVNQLSGILAHETGHIAGGHIVRHKLEINRLQMLSAASLIAAGAAAVTSGRGDAAMAVVLGSQSSLLNKMNAYQVQEERSADESAVKYLAELDQSPLGLSEFIKKISQTNRLNGYQETPYFRTHPLSNERLRFFEESLKHSKGKTDTPLDQKFKMVKAKFAAFLLPVDRVRAMYKTSQNTPEAQYAHAILDYRENKLESALQKLDNLIKKEPQNPYFHELKGQFLFESGKLKEAFNAYDQAKAINPSSPDILLARAQTALNLSPRPITLNEIISDLNQSLHYRSNLTAWLLLAQAYSQNNQEADALYASARYSMAIDNIDAARKQIEQAEKLNPSPSLKLRLSDLKNALNQE